jgi:hypothetical protein
MVECLPNKLGALSSYPNMNSKEKKSPLRGLWPISSHTTSPVTLGNLLNFSVLHYHL